MAEVTASPYRQHQYEEEHERHGQEYYNEGDGSNADQSGLQEPTEQSWRDVM